MAQAKKTVGVVLSGCGFLDGAEIHEATLTLLSLDRRGAQVVCLAPDVDQMHVVNHAKGKPAEGQRRNVLEESARIARGPVKPLSAAKASDFDALIFPGGYGAAKNLCTWATDGAKMTVLPDVARLVTDMRAAGKPLGFMCIAPVIAAKVLGHGVRLTIGDDAATAAGLTAFGATHVAHKVEEIEVDQKLKVVSTPAYMLGPTIGPVAQGIDRLVGAVLELA